MANGEHGRPNGSGLVELMRWLPGFGGYLKAEERRRADAQERVWLAERLERGKQGLERYSRVLVDTLQLEPITQVDRLRSQTDQLIGRIRGAVRGGGSFFNDAGLEAERLEWIYQHDLVLVERAAAAADAMESLGAAPSNADEKLTDIAQRLAELSDAWDTREDMLNE